jgi:cold shock CspA family protein
MQGRIDRIVHSHGFGFIRTADGREVLFHRADLFDLNFHSLREGQPVDFELPRTPEPEITRAVIVRPLSKSKGRDYSQ